MHLYIYISFQMETRPLRLRVATETPLRSTVHHRDNADADSPRVAMWGRFYFERLMNPDLFPPTVYFDEKSSDWHEGPDEAENSAGEGAARFAGLLTFASVSETATAADLVTAFARFCDVDASQVVPYWRGRRLGDGAVLSGLPSIHPLATIVLRDARPQPRQKRVFPYDGSLLELVSSTHDTVTVDADILTRDHRPALAAWIDRHAVREDRQDRLWYRARLPDGDAVATVRALCDAIEAGRPDSIPACALARAWGL